MRAGVDVLRPVWHAVIDVGGGVADIGSGVELLESGGGNGIDAQAAISKIVSAVRAGVGIAEGNGIAVRVGVAGEVALDHACGGHDFRQYILRGEAPAFVIDEEEALVRAVVVGQDDGAAERAAEGGAVVGRLGEGRVAVRGCVPVVVLIVGECGAVVVVGAALGSDDDLRRIAKFRVGQHAVGADFADGLS